MADMSADVIRRISQAEQRLDDLIEPEILVDLISPTLSLPALRGLWTLAGVGVAGEALDISGLGNHLTLQGNPLFTYANLAPIVVYDGAGDYHDITDAASANAFDILGTEPFVQTAERGLTWGVWCYPEETSTLEYLSGKWGAAAARSYILYLDASDQFNAEVSDDGTNTDVATSAAITVNAWYHVVGRFEPGASVDVFVNGTETNQASARAAVFNSASDFAIGARGDGTNPFQGYLSLAWICASYLSDAIITAHYQNTRAAYGV